MVSADPEKRAINTTFRLTTFGHLQPATPLQDGLGYVSYSFSLSYTYVDLREFILVDRIKASV